jgi:import receptor subunit TOM20
MTQLNYLIGLGSALALGSYCVYFDYKRRNDEDFQVYLKDQKKKAASMIRERRESRKKDYIPEILEMPDPVTDAEREAYLMQHLQMGERLLQNGPDAYEAAAICFCRALKHMGARVITF